MLDIETDRELWWVKKRFQGRGWWVFPFFSPHLSLVCPSSFSFSIAFKMAAPITRTSELSLKKTLLYNCLDEISAILIKPLKVQLWKAFEQSKCDGSLCKKFGKIYKLTLPWLKSEKEIDKTVMLFMVRGAGNLLPCYWYTSCPMSQGKGCCCKPWTPKGVLRISSERDSRRIFRVWNIWFRDFLDRKIFGKNFFGELDLSRDFYEYSKQP